MTQKQFEFNPQKVVKVSIEKVVPNTWNPKPENPPEMEYIKKSIQLNGYAQPILVREHNGKYEILDGQHRFLASKELGYSEIYVYNAGEVSDEDAKAMTIWMQTQIAFDEIELAPLVVELNKVGIELPYKDTEIATFEEMTAFDFDSAYNTEGATQAEDDGMKTLTIKMTPDQYDIINEAIETVSKGEDVSTGRALELLVANGLSGYPFNE